MFNVAIVEDEISAADIIEKFLEKFGRETDECFSIRRFSSAVEFLQDYKSYHDMVFMDINMPGMDGMTASRKLREIDPNVVLIFVTNMARYAVGGYEVGAFDFIVKPVSYANFAMKLRRALKAISRRDEKTVLISGKTNTRKVYVSHIRYVEVMNHVIVYHTTDGDIQTTGTMKAVTQNLKDAPFALCNQSYFVNLEYVNGINAEGVMVDGEVLPISRPRKREFLRALNLYVNNRMGG